MIRSAVHRQVPGLLVADRVPVNARTFKVVRELGSALLLWGLNERRSQERSDSIAGVSQRLRLASEELGPTFIKLGQIISSGRGVFPVELVDEFAKCRDQVPAEDFPTVRSVVESDFGRPLEEVFSEFDPTPLAAASIAQVHRAVLRPEFQNMGTSAEIVVKVQRPRVAERVHEDIRILSWLAPFMIGRIPVAALANPPALVEVFAETIVEELDFRLEAANMLDVAQAMAEDGTFVLPAPHQQLVTRRVLVMERLAGFNFEDIEGMKDAGIDTHAIIRAAMIGFLEGAMMHGVFHGDLHGGNLFVQPDGAVALFDFGITGRLDAAKRQALLRLLMSGMMSDMKGQLAAIRDLGALPQDTDLDQVIADLGLDHAPLDPTALTPDQLIEELQKFMKQLLGYGARLPKVLMLFVKNMMFVDAAIGTLAPDLDLMGEVAAIAGHFATKHGETLATEMGIQPGDFQVDLTSFKDSLGVDRTTESITYAELQQRRQLIESRLRDREGSGIRARLGQLKRLISRKS